MFIYVGHLWKFVKQGIYVQFIFILTNLDEVTMLNIHTELHCWFGNIITDRSVVDLPLLLHYQLLQICCKCRQMGGFQDLHHQREARILIYRLRRTHQWNIQMYQNRLQKSDRKVWFSSLSTISEFFLIIDNRTVDVWSAVSIM